MYCEYLKIICVLQTCKTHLDKIHWINQRSKPSKPITFNSLQVKILFLISTLCELWPSNYRFKRVKNCEGSQELQRGSALQSCGRLIFNTMIFGLKQYFLSKKLQQLREEWVLQCSMLNELTDTIPPLKEQKIQK